MPKEKRKVSIFAVLKVYWRPIKRHWFSACAVFLGMLGVGVFGIVTPLYYKQLLDLLAGTAGTHATGPLISILIIILFLNLLVWVFWRAAGFANAYMESCAMNELSQDAFGILLGHSYRYFTDNFTGTLVRRIARLSGSFEDIMDRFSFNLLPLVISITGITIVLFLRSPLLGSIFLGWTIVFLVIQGVLAVRKMRYSIRAAEKDSEATGILSDSLSNEIAVKLYTGSRFEQSLFKKVSDELHHFRLFSWFFDESVNGIQAFFSVGLEFGLMYAGVMLWARGIITIGDFALIQAYIITAISQIWTFGNNLRRIYESFGNATEMVEIMNMPYEIQNVPGARPLMISDAVITFDHVSFCFNETREILSEFNLSVAGHEKVALVGSSGAGKTTVTKLLLRLYDLDGGSICIDGQNIARVTQESLRKAVALVPQEPVLFHRTLMENIRYGRRDATDEEVVEAAKQAHCYEFIHTYPDGFETYVGERGVKLSGGERQRVAIARAILKNAPILILDEATSSLDSESEHLIQDALAKLMEGKTVIAIAHRLSTIMKMDRIIVMDGGKVIVSGSHTELLTHENGLYRKLWEIQAGGFITAGS